MTQTEALKLALEALEDLNGMAQFFPDELYSDHPDVMKAAQAITAIKEVLAQQCVCGEPDSAGTHRTDGPCLAPQPEQEPVACTSLCVECTKRGDWVCAKAIPPQRTWVGLTDEEMNAALDYWSEDERSAYGGAHAANGEYVSMIDTWRYIEAKLKEKNT